MGWLLSILHKVVPLFLEHGPALFNSIKVRMAQSKSQAQALELLATDVDQLKGYAAQLKSDLDVLNQAVAAREEKLRKWLLALVVWNIAMTASLIALAVFSHR